jgi:Type IV secretory pathway, VirB3-like protein
MKINPTFASANKALTTLGLPDDYFFLGLVLCGILALFGSMKFVLYFAGAWWGVIWLITYYDAKVIQLAWRAYRRKPRFCIWRVTKEAQKRIQHA